MSDCPFSGPVSGMRSYEYNRLMMDISDIKSMLLELRQDIENIKLKLL